MRLFSPIKTKSLVGSFVCLLSLATLPSPSIAQTETPGACHEASDPVIAYVRQVAIDATWEGTTFDGGGGIDTFGWRGPRAFLLRPEKLISIELINLENGLFDTVIVNAETILSAELGELEVVADWFDQIILDPMVAWDRTIDAAFFGQIFSANDPELPVRVRTRLDDHIIKAPQMLLQTREGPSGQFNIASSTDAEVVIEQETATDLSSATLSWPNGGFITPDLSNVDASITAVTLNMRNRVPDAVVIDPIELSGAAARHVTIESDPFDRLIMPQRGWWQRTEPDQNGRNTLIYNEGQTTEVKLSDAQNHPMNQFIPVFTQGIAETPGYRHLSADSRYTIDRVNLHNDGKDILIIRNDLHLRRGLPVFVEGDEGLDEIWFEGTAGWQVQYQDFGVVVYAPLDAQSGFNVALAPGLKFAVLPTPAFLTNPDMLNLRAYPGLPDAPRDTETLHVTRAGFVNFSEAQLSNISSLYLTNGIANVIKLTPESFVNAAMNVVIVGDEDLDTVLSEGMPEPNFDLPDRVIWTINRGNGQLQTIMALSMGYVQKAISE